MSQASREATASGGEYAPSDSDTGSLRIGHPSHRPSGGPVAPLIIDLQSVANPSQASRRLTGIIHSIVPDAVLSVDAKWARIDWPSGLKVVPKPSMIFPTLWRIIPASCGQ
jgi:hypothetical protein